MTFTPRLGPNMMSESRSLTLPRHAQDPSMEDLNRMF